MSGLPFAVTWGARTRSLLVVCLVVVAGPLAGVARADISPAQVLNGTGPVNNLLDVDGAALAPDGTGGVVYRAEVNGIEHVFVVPVAQGRWGTPVEADSGDLYGASEPAIAAGDDGRLLAVWVQPRGINSKGVTIYQLMSAYMGAGARSFGPAIMVDPTVSEPYTGDFSSVDPRLAMAPDGDAYVVYRVVDDDCSLSGADLDVSNVDNEECPPSQGGAATAEVVETRVARFAQGPWSSMGEINRAPQLAMRVPSASNAPAIAIGDGKTGLVVWQEPDATGVARVWARRLFGTTVGNVIELSPTTVNGQGVGVDADSPAAAFNDTGLATASFRLQGGSGSPFGANGEVMTQTVPASETGITPATNLAGGPFISSPSLAEGIDGETRIAYVSGGEAYATNGAGAHPVALGAASGGEAYTSVDPGGGGVTAWPSSAAGGLPVIDVEDDFPGGGSQFGELVGGVAGPLTGLSFGTDPFGDAIVAWMQGSPGDSEVVGTVASVSPQTFTLQIPSGWQSVAHARVSWNPAAASTPVTYSVVVDGRAVLTGIHGPSATAPSSNPRFPSRPVSATGEAATISRRLPQSGLGSGAHEIQIVATDAEGQTMTSAAHMLKVDRTPPVVALAHVNHGRGVRVTVSDADSGVDAKRTVISFGDGVSSHGHVKTSHDYLVAGTYTVTAHVADTVGNAATINLTVRVR